MSKDSDSSSVKSDSDSETKEKSQALVNYSKKSIFLYHHYRLKNQKN